MVLDLRESFTARVNGTSEQENVQDHPASSDLNYPTGSVRRTHRLSME